jgi:alpha-beta hydrolase superfamily lysophospholipase
MSALEANLPHLSAAQQSKAKHPAATSALQGVGNWKTYEGSWVQALNAAGFSVAGIDNRGCGRSSGLLGYVVG